MDMSRRFLLRGAAAATALPLPVNAAHLASAAELGAAHTSSVTKLLAMGCRMAGFFEDENSETCWINYLRPQSLASSRSFLSLSSFGTWDEDGFYTATLFSDHIRELIAKDVSREALVTNRQEIEAGFKLFSQGEFKASNTNHFIECLDAHFPTHYSFEEILKIVDQKNSAHLMHHLKTAFASWAPADRNEIQSEEIGRLAGLHERAEEYVSYLTHLSDEELQPLQKLVQKIDWRRQAAKRAQLIQRRKAWEKRTPMDLPKGGREQKKPSPVFETGKRFNSSETFIKCVPLVHGKESRLAAQQQIYEFSVFCPYEDLITSADVNVLLQRLGQKIGCTSLRQGRDYILSVEHDQCIKVVTGHAKLVSQLLNAEEENSLTVPLRSQRPYTKVGRPHVPDVV